MQGNAKYLFFGIPMIVYLNGKLIEFQIYSEIGCLVVSSNQTISAIKEFRHKKILILIFIFKIKYADIN